jgi:hypothetical protein
MSTVECSGTLAILGFRVWEQTLELSSDAVELSLFSAAERVNGSIS